MKRQFAIKVTPIIILNPNPRKGREFPVCKCLGMGYHPLVYLHSLPACVKDVGHYIYIYIYIYMYIYIYIYI